MKWTCAITSSVARLALQYFSALSHKRYDYRKQLFNIRYVFRFSLQILSGVFLSKSSTERDVIKMYVQRSPCKAAVIFVRF